MPAPRFKTLFLHVGLAKTGTTTIQRELLDKAATLEAHHGIHFPRGFPEPPRFLGNHSNILRALFVRQAQVRQRLSAIGLPDDEAIEAFNAANRAHLSRGFADTAAHSVLFSAENVRSFDEDALAALARWAAELAGNTRVIACVRHPVHALASHMQQRLKVGARLENLYANPPYLRLRTLFEQLEATFGRDAIVAYSFHRAVENEGGLVTELFAQLGIDVSGDFSRQPAANAGMSQAAAELLDAYNREVPPFVGGRANPARKRGEIQRLMRTPGPGFALPEAVAERVRLAVQPDVDWVCGRYSLDLSCGTQ